MARLIIREELSEASVSSITHYINDEEQNISEPKLLSITVGMIFEPEFNYDFLVKGGYRFKKTHLSSIILSQCYKQGIWNPFTHGVSTSRQRAFAT